MAFIQGEGRNQGTLFPVTLDELIPEDHVCRVIDAFVGRLDVAGLGFERAEAAETGRPGYDPRDLLKLYLYGYLQQIRSSRRLESKGGAIEECVVALPGSPRTNLYKTHRIPRGAASFKSLYLKRPSGAPRFDDRHEMGAPDRAPRLASTDRLVPFGLSQVSDHRGGIGCLARIEMLSAALLRVARSNEANRAAQATREVNRARRCERAKA